QMVAFLDAQPRVGCVGGRVLNADGSFQSSFADFPGLVDEVLLLTGLSRWLRSPSFPSYPETHSRERRPVDWVGGQFLMVRREAVDAVGLLDEDYFMYAEEMDWCYRMNRSGWSVFYLPEARAVHGLGQSSRRVPERRRALIYRSKLLFMRKHRGRLPTSIFRLLVRGVSVLKLALWLSVVPWPDAERR